MLSGYYKAWKNLPDSKLAKNKSGLVWTNAHGGICNKLDKDTKKPRIEEVKNQLKSDTPITKIPCD